ncbi:MAG: RiPP maturation radical SAM C-methyltransferase [Anaerolineae bacterium]|nr:RiPP maturation radical SAM C-methyltransferase [Anaerolineae bacterium]
MFKVPELPRGQDALIIVPPFARLNAPALGVHLLQACAREAGFRVGLVYANLHLASVMGVSNYVAMHAPLAALVGERFFAASAFDLPPLGREPERMLERERKTIPFDLDLATLRRLEAYAGPWADMMAAAIVERQTQVVGCTTLFEQTAASIALLRRVKRLLPSVVTIIGGPNCEGEMAQGIASLSPTIDYIFSGESETTFPHFLSQIRAGQPPPERIIYGQPCRQLDALPLPDFTEYYEQLERYLPELAARPDYLGLPYESSRGCWWGQKHHCTFCGLNGLGMAFRAKSPDKVISDLKQLAAQYPAGRIVMADNIMPHAYFKTLLPRLEAEIPGLRLFYEQKANLSLEQVVLLKRAGVTDIQPGIEALSSSFLKRMKKGVSARQNIALLRYARAANLRLIWNILWGFPGDQRQEYQETLALLPLLRHLQPPNRVLHLLIDRFSPYFDHPADYGITAIQPFSGYAQFLPDGVDPAQVAYHFVADYPCEAHQHPELMAEIQAEVDAWRAAWQAELVLSPTLRVPTPPLLMVTREANGRWLLRDTRGLPGVDERAWLNPQQASVALAARPFTSTAEIEWALERKVGVVLDGWYVPLATAAPELLQKFEAELERSRPSVEAIKVKVPSWAPVQLQNF